MEKEHIKKRSITPDEALNKFLNWFDFRKRLAFFTAILVGIITHITMLTEMVMSQDGLWNSIKYSRAGDWELTLGRWGIELVGRFNNFIAIPTVATMSCIIAMAITAVILVELFDLKSKISIVGTSAILVLTPTFTATLLYIYTSFAYCFNMLIAALAIWFIYKYKNKKLGIVFSSLCFMLSLSIYQSYIGVTVGLCIMLSVLQLLKNKNNIKEVFINILRTIIAVLIGGILYYIVTKILLKVSGLEIAEYKGAENASIISIIFGLNKTILQAYKDFVAFFIRDRIVYNSNYRREVMYIIFFIALGIATLINLIKLKENNKKTKYIKCSLMILFMILIPLGLNIIDILVVDTEIYSLTAVQMILIIPFAFAIFENLDNFNFIKWTAVITLILIMGTYYIADNTSYAALKLTYNQAYSTTMRIMDRIENTSEYKKDMPILFGGIVGNNNYPRTSNLYNYTIGSMVNNVAFHGTYGGQVGTWMSFLKIFYGLDIVLCPENVYYTIVNGEEYKEMEIFPAQDSIKIMDGIVVVKLSDDPPLPY